MSGGQNMSEIDRERIEEGRGRWEGGGGVREHGHISVLTLLPGDPSLCV